MSAKGRQNIYRVPLMVPMEPVLGRTPPAKVRYTINWSEQAGTLSDLRKNWGILVPSELRYCHDDILVANASVPKGISHTISKGTAAMINQYNSNLFHNSPFYRDPYHPAPERVYVLTMPIYYNNKNTVQDRIEADRMNTLKFARETLGGELHESFADELSKIKTNKEDKQYLKQMIKQKTSCRVSPHLYQPRNLRPKSEWAQRTEVALANARKKDIEQETVNRLEETKKHADAVRCNKQEEDMSNYGSLISKLREKDEQHYQLTKEIKAKRERKMFSENSSPA